MAMNFRGASGLLKIFRTAGVIALLVLVLLTGCAKRTKVVLLPDPNGKVGKVDVTNSQGQQRLDQAYQTTVVTRPDAAPRAPVLLDKAAVESEFDRALKITPALPVIYTLFFEPGTTALKDYSRALLPDIVKAIEQRRAADISVVGHTDATDVDDADRVLAFDRARKIADLLISMGVDAAVIEIGYHGAGNPLVQPPDGFRESQNRRVEVTIR